MLARCDLSAAVPPIGKIGHFSRWWLRTNMISMASPSSTPSPTPALPVYPACHNQDQIQTPVALRNALSQLSFEAEILQDDHLQLENPGTVLDGLFCLGGFNHEDNNDLFFDAEQGHGSLSAYSLSAMQVRGGDQHPPPHPPIFSRQQQGFEEQG